MTYLVHHGILGQKWGIRRYQNKDGTLTDAGKKRYAKELDKYSKYVHTDHQKYSKAKKIASEMVDTFEKEDPRLTEYRYRKWSKDLDDLKERSAKLDADSEKYLEERGKVAEEEARRMMKEEAKAGKIDNDPELRELRVMDLTEQLEVGDLSDVLSKKYSELPHYNSSWYGEAGKIYNALSQYLEYDIDRTVNKVILGDNKASMSSQATIKEELKRRFSGK